MPYLPCGDSPVRIERGIADARGAVDEARGNGRPWAGVCLPDLFLFFWEFREGVFRLGAGDLPILLFFRG